MKKFILLLCLILGLFISETRATHMMGSDITYECLGNGRYKITLKIYRDCTGVNLGGIQCSISTDTNSTTFSPTKKGLKDITPACDTIQSACKNSQSSIGLGVEEHTYEKVIDFTKAPYTSWKSNGACEFTISWSLCCRNDDITTGPKSQNFYSKAVINLCNIDKTKKKCNDSPIFNGTPIFYACCNVPFNYNFQVSEISDFDSLSYKLVAPLVHRDTNWKYYSPFSDSIPMTPKCDTLGQIDCTPDPSANPPKGFFFDEKKGDLVFTPTKCNEVGVIVVEIKEWRKDSMGNYLHIGSVRRDMQIIVMNCGTLWAPEIKSTKYDYTVCEGDKIKITVEGKDTTAPGNPNGRKDTITLNWNNLYSNATFTILNDTLREKKGEFEWQTKLGDAKDLPYYFSATATDDACPINLKTTKGFTIKVIPRPKGEISFESICNSEEYAFKHDTNSVKPKSYNWEIIDYLGDTIYSTKIKDTLLFNSTGISYLKLTLDSTYNCPTTFKDSIKVANNKISKPFISAQDTLIEVCAGEKIEFSIFAKEYNNYNIFLNLLNKPSNALFTLVDSSAKDKEGKFIWNTKDVDEQDSLYQFTVIAIDDNCPFPDTSYQVFKIRVSNQPIAKITLDETCYNFIYKTDLDSNFDLPATYDWEIIKNNTLKYTSTSSKDSLPSNLDASYKVNLIISSKYSCKDTTIRSLNTIKSPATKTTIDLSGSCTKVTYKAQLKSTFNLPASYNWFIRDSLYLSDTSTSIGSTFDYKNNLTYKILLVIKNKFGCTEAINTRIKIDNGTNFAPNIVSQSNHFDICINDTLDFTVDIKENINILDTVNLNWTAFTGPKIDEVRTNSGFKSLKLKWTPKDIDARDSVYRLNIMAHDNACPKQDTSYKTITIKVNPIPKASTKFHEFCGEQGMVYEAILDSNVKQTVLYNWSIKDSVNTLLHSSQLSIDTFRVVKLGKHFVSLEIEDGNQCKNTFTDTVNLRYSPSYLDLGKDTSITDRDSLLLKANSNFTEYLWSTGSIDSMINIIGKDIDTGNNLFWLATKDTLGCIYGDTINIFITSTVSINDWNIENLIIYPTPAKDNLQIELPTTIKNGEIKILNTEGKIVWSKLFQKNTESTLKIDISSFAKGLYIIQLKANSQVYNAKMIKE